MSLKLVLRDNEKDDEFHRGVIEGIEFDAAGRSSERRNHIFDPVGRAMWNRDAETDASTHRFFALFERGENAVAIVRFDFVETDEQIDQLDDGRPTFSRLHLGDDLLGGK